jgi:hypothetical protein
MGSFLGKSLLDNRLIDLPLSTAFLKVITGKKLTFADLKEIDADIGASIEKMVQVVHQIHEIQRDPLLVSEQIQMFPSPPHAKIFFSGNVSSGGENL